MPRWLIRNPFSTFFSHPYDQIFLQNSTPGNAATSSFKQVPPPCVSLTPQSCVHSYNDVVQTTSFHRRRDARATLRRVFDSFDSTSDLVALSVNAPSQPGPASKVLPPTGITLFSMRSHEDALAYKPPLPKKEFAKFEAPKVDPMALPSVLMDARLQQVIPYSSDEFN